jgi:predicted metal-binding protein
VKVGIIRCMQTENFCPGTFDFKAIANRTGAFEGVEEEIEIIGFISCGGCPGKNTILRAKKMVRLGADTIVLASCIQKGTPIGYPCPFAKKMKDSLVKALGEKIAILDYTHE